MMIPNHHYYQAILIAINIDGEQVADILIAQDEDRLKVERILETCQDDPGIRRLTEGLRTLHPGLEVYTFMRHPLAPLG